MKAGILKNIDDLVVEEVPGPRSGEGIIIRVRVCSICASDLYIYHHGHPRVKLPHIPGHEIAGEIADNPGSLPGFKPGDRVVISPRLFCGKCFYCLRGQYTYCTDSRTLGYELPGGFAEYVQVPLRDSQAGVVNKIPEGLGFEEASLAEPLSCCLRAQRASGVGEGDFVVVIGGGPLGIMHCRLARVNGAGKVVLVHHDPSRLQQVNLDGIDDAVDSTRVEPEQEIARLTGGRGADVVIVACSSVAAQAQAVRLAGCGGRINLFAGLHQDRAGLTLDSDVIHYREISLQGTHGSTPSDCRAALMMLGKGEVGVGDLVSHTFPLDAIKEAFALAEARTGMHVAVCP